MGNSRMPRLASHTNGTISLLALLDAVAIAIAVDIGQAHDLAGRIVHGEGYGGLRAEGGGAATGVAVEVAQPERDVAVEDHRLHDAIASSCRR